MSFVNCMQSKQPILMEGALGERLKREYGLTFDEQIAMASLVTQEEGAKALKCLWNGYINIARHYHLPFLATTPTRRANQERINAAGYDETIIFNNVTLLRQLQKESNIEMYIGGLMGCKGDAYTGEGALSAADALRFHTWQADCFRQAGVDFLYAGIMPTLSEAVGMAQAMAATRLPYIISFTIQKDGKLIDGTTIAQAIQYIDDTVTLKPICYMTNCVHPTILYEALAQPFNDVQIVKDRFLGIQANTSPLSYAELDHSSDLKSSPPAEFARDMMRLHTISNLTIFGGCCGTDHTHMEELAKLMKVRI